MLVTGQLTDAPTCGLVNSWMPSITVAVNMLKITTALKASVSKMTYLFAFSYSFAHLFQNTHRSKHYW